MLNVQIRAIEIQELPVFRFLLLKELERLMTSILPGLHQHQHRHLTTGTLLLDYSDLTPQECISESMKFQCNEIRKIVEAVGASLLSAVIVKVVSPMYSAKRSFTFRTKPTGAHSSGGPLSSS